MWESAERHTQINWMMKQRKHKGEKEGGKKCYSALFHIVTVTFGQGDKGTLATHAQITRG